MIRQNGSQLLIGRAGVRIECLVIGGYRPRIGGCGVAAVMRALPTLRMGTISAGYGL